MKLLIAEDTADLNRAVTVMLQHSGYDVDSVFDGEAALNQVKQTGYDAVILDIMMPKMDGISVLTTMRGSGINIPVLLLTAKAEVDDRVAGLNAGADDYLPKPFAMKELLARVNAMTRRRVQYASRKLAFAGFSLDTETLELSAQNTVRLSMKECELLSLLMQNAGKPLSSSALLSHIWAGDPAAGTDTVRLYLRYLQRKLAVTGSGALIDAENPEAVQLRETDV